MDGASNTGDSLDEARNVLRRGLVRNGLYCMRVTHNGKASHHEVKVNWDVCFRREKRGREEQ